MEPEESQKIASIVSVHFNNNLPKKGKPLPKEWTTLAAIVMQSKNSSSYKVVSLGTGAKCLGQSELSPKGDLVSDAHAEVLARRSFLLYIYDQLDFCLKEQESIFEFDTAENSKSTMKQFLLSPDVKFHFFTSHVPCGDAAIINSEKTQEPEEIEPDRKKIKLDKDVNRTGAKLEVGPLVYEDVQIVGKCRVKPGKGDPTLCMSCSDKIAKWQLLGLQGNLLGNFIPIPIRFSSIIVGSGVPFSKESVERAVFTRIQPEMLKLLLEKDSVELSGYFMPNVVQVKSNFVEFSDTMKSPSPGGIAWHLGVPTSGGEVVVNGRKQGATKKHFGKPSAMVGICRRNIFSKFMILYEKCFVDLKEISVKSYADAKKVNGKYEKFWLQVKVEVMKGWTTKPSNMQDFAL